MWVGVIFVFWSPPELIDLLISSLLVLVFVWGFMTIRNYNHLYPLVFVACCCFAPDCDSLYTLKKSATTFQLFVFE